MKVQIGIVLWQLELKGWLHICCNSLDWKTGRSRLLSVTPCEAVDAQ